MTGFGKSIFFKNLGFLENQVRYLVLFHSFHSNKRLPVVLDGNPSQEYSVNVEVRQDFLLGFAFFSLFMNYFCDDIIYNVVVYAENITLYSKFGEASDF